MDREPLVSSATIAPKREELVFASAGEIVPDGGSTPRRPRHILFYLYALGSGGAERVMALLASGFAARGDRVTLVLQADAPENASFISADVRIVTISRTHARAVLELARLLRDEAPDVSISALGLCNLKHTLAAMLAGRRHRAILSVHGHLDAEPQRTSRLANRLMIAMTRLTARTVCVSDWMRAHVVDDLHGAATRCVTIHNPAPIDAAVPAASASELAARAPMILAAGRLAPAKDFGLLLRAFAALDHREATLTILGEGPERGALERQVRELGITARVSLPGYALEPWASFRQARLCVVSSLTESFSNVIVEALAHGVPVVSTDCGGPREILTRPEFGELVPVADAVALTRAMARALRHPGDPAPRVGRAHDFALPTVLDAYDAVFDAILAARNVAGTTDRKPRLSAFNGR